MRYLNEGAIRSRARYLYLGDSTGLCRIVGQHDMYVDTSDVGHATHLILDGYWEMWTTSFFYAHIRPGMHVVDVGASFGYYTLIAAGLVGSGGKVTAFEPNPRIKRLLEQSIRINDFSRWASVRGEAVSDQAGEARFRFTRSYTQNAHIAYNENAKLVDEEEIAVALVRLDDMLTDKVDFMKVDVEGAELAVWAGMQRVLADNKDITIVFEFNAARYPDRWERFLAEVSAQGFPLRHLDFDGRVKPLSLDDIRTQRKNEDWTLILHRGQI